MKITWKKNNTQYELSINKQLSDRQVVADAVTYANEISRQRKKAAEDILTFVAAATAETYAREHENITEAQIQLFLTTLVAAYHAQQ